METLKSNFWWLSNSHSAELIHACIFSKNFKGKCENLSWKHSNSGCYTLSMYIRVYMYVQKFLESTRPAGKAYSCANSRVHIPGCDFSFGVSLNSGKFRRGTTASRNINLTFWKVRDVVLFHLSAITSRKSFSSKRLRSYSLNRVLRYDWSIGCNTRNSWNASVMCIYLLILNYSYIYIYIYII